MRVLPVALLLALAPLALSSSKEARAQDEKARRDALVQSEWFRKGGWTDELDKAKAESKKTGKPILAYFTVVDRESPFCRTVETKLLGQEKFVEWSRRVVPYCQVTWSRKGSLKELEAAGGRAWPWFAFLDSSGALLYPLRPNLAVAAFEEAGERVLSYVEKARRARKGDDSDRRDLVIAALDLGRIKAEKAHADLAKLGAPSEEQRKALLQAETNAFVSELASSTDPSDREAHLATARRFLEHKRSGKPLPTARGDIQAYWIAILRLAAEEKDVALYAEGLKTLRDRFGDEAEAKPFFDKCEKTLEELRAAKR